MIYSTIDEGYGVAGLGDSQHAGAIVAAGGQAAAGIVPAALASSAAASAAAGGSGLILGLAPALAVPVVGAAIAGITLVVGMWVNRKGPKQKVATTEIVNEAEPLLKQNLDAFLAGGQTRVDQQQALYNFDSIWDLVVQKCSDPYNGTPGQNCVRDRQRGSTKGYDWFRLYRDPIANAQVHEAPVTVESGVNDLLRGDFTALDSFASGLDLPKVLGGVLLVGGLWYLSSKV